jgi:hypothetical protein
MKSYRLPESKGKHGGGGYDHVDRLDAVGYSTTSTALLSNPLFPSPTSVSDIFQ